MATLKQQLHNSASHREGWDASCPVCIDQAKDIKFCVVCGNRHKPLEPGFLTCKGCTTEADRVAAYDKANQPKPMADERETAQWYVVNSGMAEIRAIVTAEVVAKYGQYGGMPMWNKLPVERRDALRYELTRIRAIALGL